MHQILRLERQGLAIPGLPELISVGFSQWTPRRPHELGGHAHADHWEIHYLVQGQILEEVEGAAFLMNGGDVLIAPPGVVHTGINQVRHRCGLCWLGIRLPERAALPGMTGAQTAIIRRRFRELGSRPFAGDAGLLPAFSGLLEEAGHAGELQPLVCRALLHVILALVTRPQASAPPAARPRSPEVAAAVALLSARLEFPLRMASLPPQVGLRRSALTRRFVAEMGVTPSEFRTRKRLEAAQGLLRGASNAEVARRLGFASPQHFVTLFRRSFGMTPGAWRKAAPSPGPAPGPAPAR